MRLKLRAARSSHSFTPLLFLMLPLLCAIGAPGCGGGGGEKPPEDEIPVVKAIVPGQGISIQQVDFEYPGGADIGSTWGRLLLDPDVLSRQTDLRDGFVSVVTAKGWAVVNAPVPALGEPPHAIYFDLGLEQSGEVKTTTVEIIHADLALRDVRTYTVEPTTFPVQKWVARAQGLGPWEDLEKVTPPEVPPITLALGELPAVQFMTFSHMQAITNIQCARNQCFPMATANSWQFLEDTGVITIPNDHSQGIGVVGDPSFGTLVGQLDAYSGRSVTSRTDGSGVWFVPMIDGAFEYLQDAGLTGVLTFRHQDRGYGPGVPSGNYTAFGSTSIDDGAAVSWQWIDDRIQAGCAVSMVFYPHAVRITGSGRTGGLPWIRYSHDANQTNDASGLENVVTFLSDPDGDGLLNMGGSSREILWVWAACP